MRQAVALYPPWCVAAFLLSTAHGGAFSSNGTSNQEALTCISDATTDVWHDYLFDILCHHIYLGIFSAISVEASLF